MPILHHTTKNIFTFLFISILPFWHLNLFLLSILVPILATHFFEKSLNIAIQRWIGNVNHLHRFWNPTRQLFTKFRLPIPFVNQKNHPIIQSMPDDSSKRLINCSNCSHKIPLFPFDGLRFVKTSAYNHIKMILFLSNKRIFDIGIRNSNNNNSPAHSIGKIDSFC